MGVCLIHLLNQQMHPLLLDGEQGRRLDDRLRGWR
jgi:hypothetical protein